MKIKILLIILGLCVLISGLVFYKKYSIKNPANPDAWLNYSFDHEFSISYPTTWIALPNKDGTGVNLQTKFFHQDDDFTMPYGDSTNVSYSIFGQTDLSDMSFGNGDQFGNDISGETNIITNVSHIKIDGLPAIEFDYYPTDNTHFVKTRIAIQKGPKLYRFDATYAENSGKQLFEKIIQTLKFN